MYKDDWVKVADHVNHVVYRAEPIRSHDDCVAAFIRSVWWCHACHHIFLS